MTSQPWKPVCTECVPVVPAERQSSDKQANCSGTKNRLQGTEEDYSLACPIFLTNKEVLAWAIAYTFHHFRHINFDSKVRNESEKTSCEWHKIHLVIHLPWKKNVNMGFSGWVEAYYGAQISWNDKMSNFVYKYCPVPMWVAIDSKRTGYQNLDKWSWSKMRTQGISMIPVTLCSYYWSENANNNQ